MEVGLTDAVLVGVAFIAAFGAATLGSTGGLLLAVMATVLPAPLAVPAHAAIEGVRYGMGWSGLRRTFSPQIVIAIGFGSFLGIGLSASFAPAVPPHAQAILLGAFLFWACWWPAPEPGKRFPYRLPLVGGITGACSVFLGETSPLVRPFIADEPVDPALVPATSVAVSAVQHGFKVLAFVLIGVDYLSMLPVLAAMIAATVAGVLLAERLRLRLPLGLASLAIRLLVSALAIRLVVHAAGWI